MNKVLAVFIPDNPQPTQYMPKSAVSIFTNSQDVNLDWLFFIIFLVLFIIFIYLIIKFFIPKLAYYLGFIVKEFEKGKKQ